MYSRSIAREKNIFRIIRKTVKIAKKNPVLYSFSVKKKKDMRTTERDGNKAKPNIPFKRMSRFEFSCVVSTVEQQGAAEQSYEGLSRWDGGMNTITAHLTSFNPRAPAWVYIQYIYVFFFLAKKKEAISSSFIGEIRMGY